MRHVAIDPLADPGRRGRQPRGRPPADRINHRRPRRS